MSDMAVAYLEDDIELLRKSDYHETILFTEDDGATPKDTTDWKLTLWIEKAANGEELDMLETDGTRIVNTPSNGQFNLNWTAAEVDAYDWATAIYRIQLDYGDENKQVFRKGKIKVV